jgi:hypothetical protein
MKAPLRTQRPVLKLIREVKKWATLRILLLSSSDWWPTFALMSSTYTP